MAQIDPIGGVNEARPARESSHIDILRSYFGISGEKYFIALFQGVCTFNEAHPEDTILIDVSTRGEITLRSSDRNMPCPMSKAGAEKILESAKSEKWAYTVKKNAEGNLTIAFSTRKSGDAETVSTQQALDTESLLPNESPNPARFIYTWSGITIEAPQQLTGNQISDLSSFLSGLNTKFPQFPPVTKIVFDGECRYDRKEHAIALPPGSLSEDLNDAKEMLTHEYGCAVFENSSEIKGSPEWHKLYIEGLFCTNPEKSDTMLCERYDENFYDQGRSREIGKPYSSEEELFASVFHTFVNHRDYLSSNPPGDPEHSKFEDDLISFLSKYKIIKMEKRQQPQVPDDEVVDYLFKISKQIGMKSTTYYTGDAMRCRIIDALPSIDMNKLDDERKKELSKALYFIATNMLIMFDNDDKVIESMLKELNYVGLEQNEINDINKHLNQYRI